MKALFIIHCQDPIYGASRSISNLIRNLDADIDIIFPVKIKKDGITKEQIERYYGKRINNVWFLPQPARLTIQPDYIPTKTRVKSIVKEILYWLCIPQYKKIYSEGKYDFIHLNSATIYPMLNRHWPMYIHIREPIKKNLGWQYRKLERKLSDARGVFYIAGADINYCPPIRKPKCLLTNPFDQTCVASVDLNEARKRFNLCNDETVYAIIGTVSENKGIDFAIQAFLEANLKNAVLLIIGRDTTSEEYKNKLELQLKNKTNIRFVGEVADIEVAFRVIDWVVQAGMVPGMGRTSLESIYAGGGSIVPGTEEENIIGLDLPPNSQGRMKFYAVRNMEELMDAFIQTSKIRFLERKFESNVPQHIEKFVNFINCTKGKK